MDSHNIVRALTYYSYLSLDVDDDIQDPNFRINYQENGVFDGILVFDTDSDCDESNKQIQYPLPELNIIDESSEDLPQLPVGKENVIFQNGNEM